LIWCCSKPRFCLKLGFHNSTSDDLVQRLADIGLGLDDPRERWRSFERFPAVLVCFESELWGGTWYVDKMIRGKRYRFAVPEATTRKQTERAEAKLKTEIFEARYGSKGKSSFVKFVDEVYLPWSKKNKQS